jgi:hypothetical protein
MSGGFTLRTATSTRLSGGRSGVVAARAWWPPWRGGRPGVALASASRYVNIAPASRAIRESWRVICALNSEGACLVGKVLELMLYER